MPVIIDGEIVPDDDPRAVQRRLLEEQQKESERRAAQERVNQGGGPNGSPMAGGMNIDANDPTLLCMLCCAGLCVVLGLVFLLWLFFLELNVGIYGLAHKVPCDKPLAAYLLGSALSSVFFVAIQLWLAHWASRNGGADYESMQRFELVMILWCMFLLMLFAVVWIILGNVWVFTSKTCKATSASQIPAPKGIMYSVYDAAYLTVLFADWLMFFQLLDSCIRWCILRNRRQQQQRAAGILPGGGNGPSLVFTPFAWTEWVSAARQGGSAGSARAARRDYPDV